MSVAVRPLVASVRRLVSELWSERARKPSPVLLPDMVDPGLVLAVEPAPDGRETALRTQLLQLTAQMRAIGPATLCREILRLTSADACEIPALLAASGYRTWTPGPSDPGHLACRPAGDGLRYALRSLAEDDAPHAPDALLVMTQQLTVLRPDAPAAALLAVAEPEDMNCLSVACALRDVVLGLAAAGEIHLAREVAAAGQLPACLTPDPLVLAPVPAQPAALRTLRQAS